MAIAEHFRDQDQTVLLTMDVLTRFAMARREVGLAAGEPATSRGYTPSVFSEVPALSERCGTSVGRGSITGIFTVMVEGDDLNEPVSDLSRATLDGHIVLSRELASSGHYPPIDLLQSCSRLASGLRKPEDNQLIARLLDHLSLFERNRQLIEIGAYRQGNNLQVDQAVAMAGELRHLMSQSVDELSPSEGTWTLLRRLTPGARKGEP
jgi:flagellum-specific ATP synthase